MKLSLRLKVVGIVVFSLLGLSILSFFNLQKLEKEVLRKEFNAFKSTSEGLVNAIGAQFFERYGDVQAFAMNNVFLSNNGALIQKSLNDYIRLYGIYDLIIIADKSGKIIYSSNQKANGDSLDVLSLRNKDVSNEEWFKNALAGKFTEDPKKGFVGTYFGDTEVDPLTTEVYGQKMLGTTFSTQLKDANGEIIGVLSTRANFKWVENEVIPLYETLKIAGNDELDLMMLNSKGEVILDYEPKSAKDYKVVDREFDIILKRNFFELKNEFVTKLMNDNNGIMRVNFDIEGENPTADELISFSTLNSHKFIETIGWKVFSRTPTSAVIGYLSHAKQLFLAINFAVMFIAVLFSFIYLKSVFGKLMNLTNAVQSSSLDVSSSSEQLQKTSEKLSRVTQEQASSIQETSASLTELAGMVEQNVKSAEESSEFAKAMIEISKNTKAAMDELRVAMAEILNSNDKIVNLSKIIEEIGEKTEVIDDIVFKTQLLSFNASVEAERAGEHGRGFAVVAQEVGNLAQMSGKAATDISSIVKKSMRDATDVASENKEKVVRGENLVRVTTSKMEELMNKLKTIVDNTNKIVEASREQSTGLNQISTSLDSFNQTTQETAANSEESSSSATNLKKQSEVLEGIVGDLRSLVTGHATIAEIPQTESNIARLPKNKEKSKLSIARETKLKVVNGADDFESSDDEWEKL
ncbi:MAG: methyl-accepting chemotaxis protein [Bacteriovoracaceae bacterium]